MATVLEPRRRVRRWSLAIVSGLFMSAQLAGAPPSSAQDVEPDAPVLYQTDPIPFTLDDIIGDATGVTEGSAGDVVIGDDDGEDTSGNIINPKSGSILHPIDSSFTFDVLDFYGANPRARDGVAEEGWAGEITADVDGVGTLTGVEFADVETDRFKAGAPLGTWAAGLGEYSAVKASTELFTVMESVLTCHQTYPYDFWDDYEDWAAGNPPVPTRTAEALAALGLSCLELTDPHDLETLEGLPGDLIALLPNENLIIEDMLVDPENNYSVTKKDDGKLLFRWGGTVKRPTDIRFQKTLPLPDEWLAVPADEKGFAVTRAELVLRHNITNNPNDQIRPEDWENEAAKGLLPEYTVDSSGYWRSTDGCYEGDGDYIPAGTIFKYPSGADPTVPAKDLAKGNTPAWYTTIERDPFQWAYDTGTDLVGSKFPDPTLGELITGPRWRMTSNKFGQNLPGLEIPAETCAPPPYQQGENRYDVGEFATTVINLLDWDAGEPRWDDAVSPLAYSAGWTHSWAAVEVPGQVVHADDAARCHLTDGTGNCVTELGTTLTEDFDVTFYVKGDQKPLQIYDVQLVVEYEPYVAPEPEYDFGDAPDTYGTLLASDGARHAIGSVHLGATIDAEADALVSTDATGDDLTGIDDEDGVTFTTLTIGEPASATVQTTGTGYVSGWIDFDGDGTFGAAEQVATDATVGVITFTVPETAVEGVTLARFRIADATGVGAIGDGGVGEVEDHLVELVAPDPPDPPDPPEVTESMMPITPVRALDTRDGLGFRTEAWDGTGPVVGGTSVMIPVTGLSTVPDDAEAVAVNLTVVDPEGKGHLTVYPCDEPRPLTSVLNYPAGRTVGALTFGGVGADGGVCLYSSATTDLVVDVMAYTPAGGTYEARTPERLVDTRVDGGIVAAGETRMIDLPELDGTALAVSVISTETDEAGYLTVFGCASDRPPTATLNTSTERSVANMTVVPNDDICVYSKGITHVVVDLQGAFTGDVTVEPTRLLDTRDGSSIAAGTSITLDPAVHSALDGATVAAMNLTATDAESSGHLIVWNCADTRPMASALNYLPGENIGNLAVVDVSSELCIYSRSTTDVVVDLTAVLP